MAGLGIGPLLSAVVGGAGAGYARQTNINRDRDLREKDMLFRQDMADDANLRAEDANLRAGQEAIRQKERHKWSFEEYGQRQADRAEKKDTERAKQWKDDWRAFADALERGDKREADEAVLRMNKSKDPKRHKGSFLTYAEAPADDLDPDGEDGILIIGPKGSFTHEDGKPIVVPKSVLAQMAAAWRARTDDTKVGVSGGQMYGISGRRAGQKLGELYKTKETAPKGWGSLGKYGTFNKDTGQWKLTGANSDGSGGLKNVRGGIDMKESDVRAMERSASRTVAQAFDGSLDGITGKWTIPDGNSEAAVAAMALAVKLYLQDAKWESIIAAAKFASDASKKARDQDITLDQWMDNQVGKKKKEGGDRDSPGKKTAGNKNDFMSGVPNPGGRAAAGRGQGAPGVARAGGVGLPGANPQFSLKMRRLGNWRRPGAGAPLPPGSAIPWRQ